MTFLYNCFELGLNTHFVIPESGTEIHRISGTYNYTHLLTSYGFVFHLVATAAEFDASTRSSFSKCFLAFRMLISVAADAEKQTNKT